MGSTWKKSYVLTCQLFVLLSEKIKKLKNRKKFPRKEKVKI